MGRTVPAAPAGPSDLRLPAALVVCVGVLQRGENSQGKKKYTSPRAFKSARKIWRERGGLALVTEAPSGLGRKADSKHGNLLVVDRTNRLQVFSSEGKHLCTRTATSDCMKLRSRALRGAQAARLQWRTAMQTRSLCGIVRSAAAVCECKAHSLAAPAPSTPSARTKTPPAL
jgi:hypothetical protein